MLASLLAAQLFTAPPVSLPPDTEEVAEQAPRSDLEIEVGARVLLRPEARASATFGAQPGDDEWRVRQSARLISAVRYRSMSLVFQPQDVRDWGMEATTLSNNGATTHQAYFELGKDGLGAKGDVSGYLRFGRQEVILWNRRLLAQSPWQPQSRAFDGVRGAMSFGKVGFEAAAMVIRMPHTFSYDDNGETVTVDTKGEQLYWGEAHYKAHPGFNMHVTALSRIQHSDENNPNRLRKTLTPGVWFHGEPLAGLKYEVEGYAQVGENDGLSHLAWALNTEVGYTFAKKPKPGLRVAYEIVSGGACNDPADAGLGCTSDRSRNFIQYFGAHHFFRGFADLVGYSNIRDVFTRLSFKPAKEVGIFLDHHYFQLDDPAGAWRRTSTALVGTGWDPNNTNRNLGHEFDLWVDYRPNPYLRVRPTYSFFMPVGVGAELTGTEPQHFVFIWLIAKMSHKWRPTLSGKGH